jgi:hypothetical protein
MIRLVALFLLALLIVMVECEKIKCPPGPSYIRCRAPYWPCGNRCELPENIEH